MPPYSSMPTLVQWQKDSSASYADPREPSKDMSRGVPDSPSLRKQDVILSNIDDLIGQYERTGGKGYQRLVITCSLLFSLDYWLKVQHTDSRINKRRAPAVEALHKFVAFSLCEVFQRSDGTGSCTINTLPRELELMFGKELTKPGIQVDILDRAARYMTRAEAEKYRIIFKNGKAYQFPWWEPNPSKALALCDSARAAAPEAHVNDTRKHFLHYGFFTLSMGRDLYMAKHESAKAALDANNKVVKDAKGKVVIAQQGIYHSSYLAGVTAMAAGSMRIKEGVVKGIRSDSGHYQPKDTNMISVLQTLQMLGVNIDSIEVWDHSGQNQFLAREFMGDYGDWTKLLARHDEGIEDRKAMANWPKIKDYMDKHKVDEPTARRRLKEDAAGITLE